ncbi:MAG: Flp pilus assembly protein CpaB, partial [bacterium]
KEGERAVTVGITEVSGLGGNIKPGDNVDVLVTILTNEEVGVASTFTILRDVNVMAVGQDIGFDESGESGASGPVSKSVTLRVTPYESETLSLASEVGSLRLALRRPDELYSPATTGTALTEFTKYTPTKSDLEKAAQQAQDKLDKEHDAYLKALAAGYAQNQAANDGGEIPNDYYPPLDQIGPPPILVEVILGGQAQVIQLPPEKEKKNAG